MSFLFKHVIFWFFWKLVFGGGGYSKCIKMQLYLGFDSIGVFLFCELLVFFFLALAKPSEANLCLYEHMLLAIYDVHMGGLFMFNL